MTKKTTNNQPTTSLNIYQKLQAIQSEIKELVRTEENKFQKYFFFNELQVLQLLKPLLDKYKLTLLLSDDTSQPLIHEKDGKEHYLKYLKKLEIVDCEAIDRSLSHKGQQIINTENPADKLSFNFWACGSNVDLAKAKGSTETYATKYLLTKFFLMPVKDEGDPDYKDNQKEEDFKQKINSLFAENKKDNSINNELINNLINLFRKKTTDNKERQTILTKLDELLVKQGIAGITEPSNFRQRLTSLTPLNYQELYNWLLKLEES